MHVHRDDVHVSRRCSRSSTGDRYPSASLYQVAPETLAAAGERRLSNS